MNFNSFEYYALRHKKDVDKVDFDINLKYISNIFSSLTDEFIKQQIARYNVLGSNNKIWLAFFINYIYFDQKEGTIRLGLYEFEDQLYVNFIEDEKFTDIIPARLLAVKPSDLPLIKKFLYQQGLKRFEENNRKTSDYHFDVSDNSVSAMSEAIQKRIEHKRRLQKTED